MQYLDGPLAPFSTIEDRRALVGKVIKYLRKSDIDHTGRGYFFPRIDVVERAFRTQLVFEGGDSVSRGDLKEVQILNNSMEQP